MSDTNLIDFSDGISSGNEKYFSDNYVCVPKEKKISDRFFAPIKGGSLRGSIISMISICFGTACLSFPKAIDNIGLIPGLILMIVIFIISYWSLYLLLITARKKRILDYSLLIQNILGDNYLLFSDIVNLLCCYGIMMAYEFTISSFYMGLMNTFFGIELKDKLNKGIQMLASMFLVLIPLGLLKNISKLQYASMVGIMALFYTLIVMIIELPFYINKAESEGRRIVYFKKFDWSSLDSFSFIFYAYCSHNGILSIYKELLQPSKRRSMKVLNRGLILQFIVFTVIALAGFFSNLNDTPSIFINMTGSDILFNGRDIFIIISKVLYFFCLHCNCTINLNIMKGSIRQLIFKNKEPKFLKHLLVIFAIYGSSFLLTFFIDDISTIIGFLSGLCIIFVSYVNPVLCYVKSNNMPRYHWKNLTAVLIMVVVSILGILATVKTIIDYTK
jgi:amino acid permease